MYLKSSFKFQVSSFRSRSRSCRLANSKPETRNSKLRSLQRGFSIVTAIFLVVVLALLGVFIVSVTGMQLSSHQLDVLGARAYQAARAGIEWGAFQVLDPNNTINTTDCSGTTTKPTMPLCPGA